MSELIRFIIVKKKKMTAEEIKKQKERLEKIQKSREKNTAKTEHLYMTIMMHC